MEVFSLFPTSDESGASISNELSLFGLTFTTRWPRGLHTEYGLAVDLKGFYVTRGVSTCHYNWFCMDRNRRRACRRCLRRNLKRLTKRESSESGQET